MPELRPYQLDAKRGVYRSFNDGNRAVMLQLPTGGGKSVILSSIVGDAIERGKRALMMVHRKELVEQLKLHMHNHNIYAGIIMAGFQTSPSAMAQVASVQTLTQRLDRIHLEFDLLVTDECFPAGTLVDGKPIEQVRIGDYVRSYNHETQSSEYRRVTHMFQSHAECLVRLRLSDETTITCTVNHPFYTPTGYVCAKQLNAGSYVYRITELPTTINLQNDDQTQSMRSMQRDLPAEKLEQYNDSNMLTGMQGSPPRTTARKSHDRVLRMPRASRMQGEQSVLQVLGRISQRKGVLLDRMQRQIHSGEERSCNGRNQSQARIRENDQTQSNVSQGCIPKNVCINEGQALQESHGQWSVNQTADSISGAPATTNGVRDQNQARATLVRRNARLLQVRHRRSVSQTINRDRRQQPQATEHQTGRPKENDGLKLVRVESVEILELGCGRGFGEVCPDGLVYNLEVEGNNNYFADGILVHNCHHSTADSYRKIYARWDKAKHLGVTATPCRTDGSGFADVFDDLVLGPSVRELIDLGFLVRPKVYASPLRFDLSKIKITAGDYNDRALYEEMDKTTITASIVDSWKKHALGLKTCVFCINVEHSEKIAAAYNEAGITARAISAKTDKDTRARVLRDFARGSITVLTNCDIISEGLDVPAIECVQLARPTKSLAKYLQCVGRGLRPLAGKESAIVLDHADCVFRHGFPDDDRVWTLDGIKAEPAVREIKLKDTEGREYSRGELPEEITDVELIEVDSTDFRRRQLMALVEAARTLDTPNYSWAWREFIKAVKLPTKEEINLFEKEAGYKRGWAFHQKIQFGFIKKTPDYVEKYEKRATPTLKPQPQPQQLLTP